MLRLTGTSLTYENFELYNPTISLELIVWSLCIGLCVGAVLSFINNRVIGGYARYLIKNGILTPEKAQTLEESGYGKNIFVRSALKEGKPLRRMVRILGEEEREVSDADLKTARIYIPEEMRITAEIRYEERGNSPVNLILSLLLLIALALVVLFVMPELLQMIDNFLTMVK